MSQKPDISDPAPDPRAREQAKSKQEQAEDIAYTVNHAISCGVTDVFVQPVAAAAATALAHEELLPKWATSVFEHHDHDHGHGHDHHDHHDHHHHEAHAAPADGKGRWQRIGEKIKGELQWKKFGHNLKHWVWGETIGDAGGIIPTIMVQRMFPGFMQGLRDRIEPIAGAAYRGGAHRDAQNWGRKHGLALDSAEVKAREEYLYKHEMDHLPQAVVWNAFSIPINGAVQLGMEKPSAVNTPKKFMGFLTKFAIGKGFGTIFSNGILLGGRAVAPDAFIAWDKWNSDNVLKPVLYGPGQLLGIDKETADKVMADKDDDAPPVKAHKHARDKADKQDWRERTRQDETAVTAEPAIRSV